MPDFRTRVWDNERIYMVDFGRGKSGSAHRRYPEVDNIGFQDDAQATEHGCIVPAMNGHASVRVRFYRTEISTAAPLFAVSSDTAIVRLNSPGGDGKLDARRSQLIDFRTIAAGRAAIEIRYGYADGPVIGRLFVQVNQRVNIPLRIHTVTLPGAAHGANFLGVAAATQAQRRDVILRLIRGANEYLVPHGLVLTILADSHVNTAWTATEMGANTATPTVGQIMQAGALSPNRMGTRLNIFLLPQWTTAAGDWIARAAAAGVSVPWARNQGFSSVPAAGGPARSAAGIYVRTNLPVSAHDFAHEFGHYMGLCTTNLATGAATQFHCTGDLTAAHTRDDIVSRRRVMYPIQTLLNSGNAWRNDVGYGNAVVGGLFTCRRATQDITFEESRRGHSFASGAGFYAL
jgi:hypothetical protein